jgi:hypothetical protein
MQSKSLPEPQRQALQFTSQVASDGGSDAALGGEGRRGEEMFARRRGVFAKEESLDSRLLTCEYRISSAAGTSTLDQREG